MTLLATEVPYTLYFDRTGAPLDGGSVYFGIENQDPQTNPIAVYWDAAGTQPVAQPVRTQAGFPVRAGSIAQVYCASAYSVTVLDAKGQLVRYAPSSQAWSLATAVASVMSSLTSYIASVAAAAGATLMGFIQQGVGAVQRTVAAKLYELQTSADFAGWGTQCVSVGINNLPASSLGSGNIAVGYNNLLANTTGYANKVFGNNCLQAATTGFYNYAFGDQVLQSCTTGTVNNGFGIFTLGYLTTGSANSAFGDDNQRYATTASYNASGGSQSQYNNLTGVYNASWGCYSMRGSANPPDAGPGTGPSPSYCSGFGANSLYTATGTGLTGLGYSAGYNATGDLGTYVGTNAGLTITSGTGVSVGANSCNNGAQPATAVRFAVFGASAYGFDDSVVLGDTAIAGAVKGIAIGSKAQANGVNSIAIGYGVVAPNPNQIVIGNSSNTGNFFYGGLLPQIDNSAPVGGASARWSVIYAGTGTINTSDAREKQDIAALTEAEKRVGVRLRGMVKTYRWITDVQAKGDAARTHAGWIAQDVIAAFRAEGLDAMRYGVCCYDTWTDESGNACDRYGVRHDELISFILGAM